MPSKTPLTFTTNLFNDVKDYYCEIIDKGFKMLSQKMMKIQNITHASHRKRLHLGNSKQ